jgi:undecaprenyl pyrophosphate phosphatase UppP
MPLLKAYFRGASSEGAMAVAGGSSALLGGYSPWALLLGALTSFVVGLISLRWLLNIITRRGLDGFVYYVLTAAALTFLWQGYEYFVK